MTAIPVEPTAWRFRCVATRVVLRTRCRRASCRLWKTSASYRSQRGTVAAWLLIVVVRHRAIDLARRNGNHATRWASDDRLVERPALDDVSERVIQRDNADHLRRSLEMLSDDQREVITLAYYGQLSHTEITHSSAYPPNGQRPDEAWPAKAPRQHQTGGRVMAIGHSGIVRVLLVDDDEDDWLIIGGMLANQTRARFAVELRLTRPDEALAAIDEQRHEVSSAGGSRRQRRIWIGTSWPTGLLNPLAGHHRRLAGRPRRVPVRLV